MDTKKLAEVFNMPEDIEDIDALVVKDTEESTSTQVVLSKNEQYIDQHIKDVVESVNEAKEDILNLARITESPRAFEVYSTLLNTKLSALSKLSDIEKYRTKNGAETINNTQINIDSAGVNINELLKNIRENK